MIQTQRVALEKDKPKQLCKHNSSMNVLIRVEASRRIYLGGSNVTIESGFPLDNGVQFLLPNVDYSMFYVISSDKNDVVYLLVWR